MIFRGNNAGFAANPDPLQRIHQRIGDDAALRLSILDAVADDDVLVIFCTEITMIKMVKIALQDHWPGEIEVFCPAALMTGSSTTGNADTAENNDKSMRYIS